MKEQLLIHPLTKAIISILGKSKKQLSTTQIYNELLNIKNKDINSEIKGYYPDRKQSNGSIKKGLNRNTVLDHLNEMHRPIHDLLFKKIIKNNIAVWGLKKELPFEYFIFDEDKFLLNFLGPNYGIIRHFKDYDINLYGYPNNYSHLSIITKDVDALLLKNNEEKLINGIKKIKKGLNEIQYARENIYNWHKFSIYNLIFKFKNISLLDKRIFAILMFFDYSDFPFLKDLSPWTEDNLNNFEIIFDKILTEQPFIINLPLGLGEMELTIGIEDIHSQFTDFLTEFKNLSSLIITDPHPDLLYILKNNFKEYQSKTDNELRDLLKGHKFPRYLLNTFLYNAIGIELANAFYPLIAVCHSESLFNIISELYKFNEVDKYADYHKLNKGNIKHKFLNITGNEKEEKKYSYFEFYKKMKKKKIKCPVCDKDMGTKRFNINEFLQYNMRWLQ